MLILEIQFFEHLFTPASNRYIDFNVSPGCNPDNKLDFLLVCNLDWLAHIKHDISAAFADRKCLYTSKDASGIVMK